jgi:hypothetical protein
MSDILTDLAGSDDIRRLVRDYDAKLRARDAELAELRRRLDLVTAIAGQKLTPPRWLVPPRSPKGHHGIAAFVLTDTHLGEVVNPLEVDGLNAYDDAIASRRLRTFAEKAVRMGRDFVNGIAFDGAVLFVGGDIFSGDIHDELLETNAETTYASVIRWLDPLEAIILTIADHYGSVHVAVTYGNHGRRTRKPRAKRRAQDNIEWLLWRVIQRSLAADRRITWQVPDSADTLVPVYGHRFLLTHGDQFRGGSGISGALAPLMLGSHRKTRRAQQAGRPYDVMVMGHFHQYLTLPGVIVSGCLKGTDEYSFISNFGHEEPQQAFWVVTPERPVTFSAPIHVSDRKAEGW